MAFEPWAGREPIGLVECDIGPSEFGLWTRGDAASEDAGHELATEADAEDRDTCGVGGLEKLYLRKQPVADDFIFPNAPRGSHGDDGIEGSEVWKRDGDVGLVETFWRDDVESHDFVPAFSETTPHLSSGADGIVFDEQRFTLKRRWLRV
jgi:hypothetical protein